MNLLSLTEEDSGMLMSTVGVNVHMCGGRGEKGSNGSWARGLKVGQLTLSLGLARAEVCCFIQTVSIPSRRVIFYIYKCYTCTRWAYCTYRDPVACFQPSLSFKYIFSCKKKTVAHAIIFCICYCIVHCNESNQCCAALYLENKGYYCICMC